MPTFASFRQTLFDFFAAGAEADDGAPTHAYCSYGEQDTTSFDSKVQAKQAHGNQRHATEKYFEHDALLVLARLSPRLVYKRNSFLISLFSK